MTALNATACRTFAMMSSDRLVSTYPMEGLRPITAGPVPDQLADDGTYSTDWLLQGEVEKLVVLDHARLILAGGGLGQPVHEILAELRKSEDIHVAATVGGILARLASRRYDTRQFLLIAIGWDERRGEPLMLVFSPDRDFAPREIAPCSGHVLSPPYNARDPHYADLHAAWTAAALGTGTMGFHALLAGNQHRSSLAGKLPYPIGPTFDVAMVDAEGARLVATADVSMHPAVMAAPAVDGLAVMGTAEVGSVSVPGRGGQKSGAAPS